MSRSKNYNRMRFLATFGTYFVLCLIFTPADFAQVKNFNKRPFINLAERMRERIDKNEVNLSAPFSIEVLSDLTKEGRLKNAKLRGAGDEKMVEVGKEFIAAISDSDLLKLLSDEGIEQITLRLSQNENQVTGSIESELKTKAKASKIASAFSSFISSGKQIIKNNPAEDEVAFFFLNGWTASTNGKKFQLSFLASRDAVQQLVKKSLEKTAAKETNE